MLRSISWYVYFFLCMVLGTFLFVFQEGGNRFFGNEIFLLFTVLLLPVVDIILQSTKKEKLFQTEIFDLEKYLMHYIIFFGILFSFWYGGFQLIPLLFWGFFLIGIIFGLNPKIPFIGALILFIYIPFALILEQKIFAEQLSIYAYYFLIIGVVFELSEFVVPKIKNRIGK